MTLSTIPQPPAAPSSTIPSSSVSSISQTLYVSNLPTKPRKHVLASSIYAFFSPFGQIIDLYLSKRPELKGQAFVVFKEATSAVNAMRVLQGYPFWDRPMRIAFSKKKSKAIIELEGGTFFNPRKIHLEEGKEEKEKEKEKEEEEEMEKEDIAGEKVEIEKIRKRKRPEEVEENDSQSIPPQPIAESSILIISNIPNGASIEMLKLMFSRHSGFLNVKFQNNNEAIAEFKTVADASHAKIALDGFKIDENNYLRISFGPMK